MAFGDFFLMDFHKLLEKSLRKKRLVFFHSSNRSDDDQLNEFVII